MNDISVLVEQLPVVQPSDTNNRNDEGFEMILVDREGHHDINEDIEPSERLNVHAFPTKYQTLKRFGVFSLFTIVLSTVGIIVVCLTSPSRSNGPCVLTFVRSADRIYTYDSSPQDVATGDFDRDNKSDLVIANYAVDSIGIRLSYGNGTFTDQITYSTGAGSLPYWVSIADFNNDAFLDIAVANYGTNNIGVFLGDGKGNFGAQLQFSLDTSRPVALGVGDFNNDKLMDIVVANNGTFNVTILLGFGNGSFQIGANYFMGYDTMPCSIAVADLNNDGLLDIVVVNCGTSDVAIFLATTNGTFLITRYSTGKGSNPCSVTTGDFNNDNYTDLAVANSGTNNIVVVVGNGNGTFSNLTKYPIASNADLQFIAAGDFNNNNRLDLAVASAGDDSVFVFQGYGNGSFSLLSNQSTGYNSDPCSIAVNDFDHDGNDDIAVVNSGSNYLFIYTSYAFHTTATQSGYSTGTGSYPNSIVINDFTNDSQLDIIVADTYNNDLSVFLPTGNDTFNIQDFIPVEEDNAGPYSVAAGDFNKDKILDIAVAMVWGGTVDVYFGQNNGSFEFSDSYLVGDDYSYPYSVAIADFNNDTNLDIVTANCDGDTVALLLGTNDGTFTDGGYHEGIQNSCPMFISVGDFNRDGLLDVVSANYGDATISIYLGNGDGTFQNSTPISIDGYWPTWLVVQDLNKDNNLDIVFAAPDYSLIGIMLGNGNGTFKNIVTYATGSSDAFPWSIASGDFNNDTIVDIAAANAQDVSIKIFYGRGNGTFTPQDPIDIDYVSFPQCIATGDFDNNNVVDIVVGNGGSDDISVLLLQYQAAFGTQTSYQQGSGSHPFSVTTCDFNNDSQADIVVANAGDDNVQILIGYNNQDFTSIITYSTGISSHPFYATTADFNKDGQLDIAVVNYYDNTLMIFLIFDNGRYNTSTLYTTGSKSFPSSIGLGDFNKDGWIDIVVANSMTDNVGVFLGFAYPTFSSNNIRAPVRNALPFYVVVGDFNRDSQWDIAIADQNLNGIGILLGNGNGTFFNHSLYSVGESAQPYSLVIGDFNNDNLLDIAAANARTNSTVILLGNGDGTFADYRSSPTEPSAPISIAVGDFNKDSKQDLVVASSDGNNIGVFMGYGNGSFAKQISYAMPNGSSPISVAVSDFNNDNISDIAVANRDGNNIGILLGYGNGTFRNVTMYSTGNGSRPYSIAVGDFNKDNCMDIAVANLDAKNVAIFFGNCDGTFLLKATYSTGARSSLQSIIVQDLNNDKIIDIAVADWGSGNANIGVLYGSINGTFLVPTTYSLVFNSQPTSIAICDFNNDGRADLAVSNSKKNNIGIMLQNGSQPFGVQTTLSTGNGSGPYSVAVIDFNNDGQLDIAVANSKTNNTGIFFGYGNGSFANQKTYSTGDSSGPMSIAIGDLNNDKQFDIVVANSQTNNIGILLGYGNTNFSKVQLYSTGAVSGPTSVSVADLNADNQTDIVVTNAGINSVLIFYGFGNGTFANSTSFLFEYATRPIASTIGDFNNDGLLDIGIANNGLGYVEVLLQTC